VYQKQLQKLYNKYHSLLTCGCPESKDKTVSPTRQAFSNLRRHIPFKEIKVLSGLTNHATLEA